VIFDTLMTKDPGPDPLKGNRLLAFLKNTKTERYRIYQPYAIRILLEQGAENNFSMKESEIVSKILSLALHKTKKSVDKSLLKGYLKGLTSASAYTWNSDLVFLGDDSDLSIWKLNPDEFHESQTEEILEQCNIQIGKFHVHASIDTKSKPEVYFIFAGKNESTNITWVSIAAQVLIENSGKPLHYKNEIGPKAVAKNLKSTNAQTPEETILRDIRHHMERFGEDSFFTNPETATYGLKESMTFKQAIELVLFAYHKPMKSSEISKIIVENSLKHYEGETPERTISTELIRDIENGDSSTFVKFDENKYALRRQTFQNISDGNSNWYEEFLENIQDSQSSLDWETAGIDYREHANFDLTTKSDEELRELPKGTELTTIKNIKKGSIVVINKNNSDGIVNTGIVTKEYHFEKDSTSYIHRVGIKYLNIPIPEINYEYNQGIYHSPKYQNQILQYLLGDKKDLINKEQGTDTLSVNHDRTIEILRRKKNIILSGPPGTGKTYTAKQIAKQIVSEEVNDDLTSVGICFPSDQGVTKIEKFQEFLKNHNNKLLWGIGSSIKSDIQENFPINGYIYFKGNIIAIAQITKITSHDETSESEHELRPERQTYPDDYKFYLHIDKLELCDPFSHKILKLEDPTKTMPDTVQQRVYVRDRKIGNLIQGWLRDSTGWFDYLVREIESIFCEGIVESNLEVKKHMVKIKSDDVKKEKRIWMSYANKNNELDKTEVGIKENGIEFLEGVDSQNAFVIVVNLFTRHFVILPYGILSKYGNFRGGDEWDETGKTRKWFSLLELTENKAILNVHDSVDISAGLNNFDLLGAVAQTTMVTFHQSYGYEEFIEGIRPEVKEGTLAYPIKKGVFWNICNAARVCKKDHVIIIDEINRGNISKIFGELITIIENDKRGDEVTLSYSGKKFSVPENVYVIGTMNTADQSLTQIDAALKRRFSTVEVMPNSSILEKLIEQSGIGLVGLPKLLDKINDKIRVHRTRHNQIGHSYFMHDDNVIDSIKELQFVFATDVIPLLQDYFYADEDALKDVLNNQFIDWGDDETGDLLTDWQDDDGKFKAAIKSAFDIDL